MDAFRQAVHQDIDNKVLKPLLDLLVAKKSNNQEVLDQGFAYFEKLFETVLTKKTEADTVVSANQVT